MTLALQGKSRRRQGLLALAALFAVFLGLSAALASKDSSARATEGQTGTAQLKAAHVGASSATFSQGTCPDSGFEGAWGWHFVLQGNSTDFVEGEFSATFSAEAGAVLATTYDGKHVYVYTEHSGTLLSASAQVVHNGGNQELDTEFNLSHICPGAEEEETGTIYIVKVGFPTSGSVDFTSNVEGHGSFSLTPANDTEEMVDIEAGTYTVTEAAVAGWNLQSVTCDDGTAGSTTNRNVTVTLGDGETITCTFINVQAQVVATTVTVTKECAPGLTETAVQFQIGTGEGQYSDTIDCGDEFTRDVTGETSVVINEHNVGTLIPTISCNGSALVALDIVNGYNLTLLANQANHCTIINHPAPAATSVTVTKECAAGLTQTAVQFQIGTGEGQYSGTIDCDDHFTRDVSGETSVVINEHNVGTLIPTISCNGSALVPLDIVNGYNLTLLQNQANHCTIVNHAPPAAGPFTVTIAKYLNLTGGLTAATAENTNSASFSMHAVFPGGEGDFALDADGFNGGPAYQAETAEMPAGSNYSAHETGIDMDCDDPGDEYRLLGYKESAVSLADAAGQASYGDGSFTDLQSNQYIVVVNEPCGPVAGTGSIRIEKVWNDNDTGVHTGPDAVFTVTGTGVSGFTLDSASLDGWWEAFTGLDAGSFSFTEVDQAGWHLSDITCADDTGSVGGSVFADSGSTATVTLAAGAHVTCVFTNDEDDAASVTGTVTIAKYIEGDGHATGANTNNATFSFDATWDAANIGAGSGSFSFNTTGFNTANAYEAVTADMSLPFDYTVAETGIDSDCDDQGDIYRLLGYRVSSISLADAESQDLSQTVAIDDADGNRYVIVVNQDCADVVAGTGSIRIEKVWVGNDPGENTGPDAVFTVTGSGVSGFTLNSASVDGSWEAFTGLAAGSFSFTETDQTGWHLSDISCSTDAGSVGGSGFSESGSTAGVTLAAGAHVTCVFTNDEDDAQTVTRNVTIKKVADAAGVTTAANAFTGMVGTVAWSASIGGSSSAIAVDASQTVMVTETQGSAMQGFTTVGFALAAANGACSTDPTDYDDASGYSLAAGTDNVVICVMNFHPVSVPGQPLTLSEGVCVAAGGSANFHFVLGGNQTLATGTKLYISYRVNNGAVQYANFADTDGDNSNDWTFSLTGNGSIQILSAYLSSDGGTTHFIDWDGVNGALYANLDCAVPATTPTIVSPVIVPNIIIPNTNTNTNVPNTNVPNVTQPNNVDTVAGVQPPVLAPVAGVQAPTFVPNQTVAGFFTPGAPATGNTASSTSSFEYWALIGIVAIGGSLLMLGIARKPRV